jgi:hypothetical protein
VGQPVLIGQMCPSAAAGRPAIRPLFRRAERWTDRAAEVASPVERYGARQFSVLAWNGRRAGLFAVAGSAALDGAVLAIGGYAGRSPCEKPRGLAAGGRDPACVAVLRDCGVAVGVIEPAGGYGARPVEEDPDPPDLSVGGGCVAGGLLLVDIDGDGAPEAYPARAFADPGAGGPAAEVAAVDHAGRATCPVLFAARDLLGGMDLLAVFDADADGRNELVVGFQRAGRSMWALYAATATPARLDRVAVAEAWRGR